MQSVSAPCCPGCRQPMVRKDDGSWECQQACDLPSDESHEAYEPRSKVVRVLVTPSTFRRIEQAAGEKSLSTWGNDVFKMYLDALEKL